MTVTGAQPGEHQIDYPPVRRASDWLLIVLIAVVGLVTLVAFVKPAWALRIALITLILAACGAAAWWLFGLMAHTQPETLTITPPAVDRTDSSPDLPHTTQRHAPLAVSELQHPMGVAGLSSQGTRYLQFVATERLWANHRLNLQHQPHHASIVPLMSPLLWSVLAGEGLPHDYRGAPLTLAQLLHEIESL